MEMRIFVGFMRGGVASKAAGGVNRSGRRTSRSAGDDHDSSTKSPEDVQQRKIIVKLAGESVGELFYGDTILSAGDRGTPPITGGQYLELEDS